MAKGPPGCARKDSVYPRPLTSRPDGIICLRLFFHLIRGDFMFRRFRIPAVLILLLAFMAAAQAQVAQPPQPKPRRFLMWKATSPTVTVYLVGSIHVGDSGMYPLPREVESAFAAARILTVEINIKNADQAKAMALVQKYGMYGADDALGKHISKETSEALDDFCSKHGLPRAGLEPLKPWVVAVTIAAISWKEAGE